MFRSAVLFVLALACTEAAIVVNTTSYLRIPNHNNRYNMFEGVADAMAFDEAEQLLYVVGGEDELLSVIDVSDKINLRIAQTFRFTELAQGIPLDVAVCRSSQLSRLAISFAADRATYEGHVITYDLLARDNLVLTTRENAAVEPDPKSIKFGANCERIVVACEGRPGKRDEQFYDPAGHVEVLQLNPLGSITAHTLDFGPDNSNIRQVYRENNENIIYDLEPEVVAIGSNDVAYVAVQENNALGGFNLQDVTQPIQLYDIGVKNFTEYDIDTSDMDDTVSPGGDGINIVRRNVYGFYQPGDMDVFQFNGEDYLITADQGARREYTVADHGVDFSEATRGRSVPVGDLSVDDTTQQDLGNNAAMGRLYVSQLKQISDGYDPQISQAFTSIRTYGARGFSIWRPSDRTHVYNSGGDFELYMRDNYPSTFNTDCLGVNRSPSQDKDSRSDDMGPEPSAVVTGMFQGQRIAVIGSGKNGALYIYSIENNEATGAPTGVFQSIFRAGSDIGNWGDLYDRDLAGHPTISDLEFVENADGSAYLFVLGASTGSLAIYTVNQIA